MYAIYKQMLTLCVLQYTYSICSLCWSLISLVTVHKVLNALEISKYTCLFFMLVS